MKQMVKRWVGYHQAKSPCFITGKKENGGTKEKRVSLELGNFFWEYRRVARITIGWGETSDGLLGSKELLNEATTRMRRGPVTCG